MKEWIDTNEYILQYREAQGVGIPDVLDPVLHYKTALPYMLLHFIPNQSHHKGCVWAHESRAI